MTHIANYNMWEAPMMFVGDGLGPKQPVRAGIRIIQVCTNTSSKDALSTLHLAMFHTWYGLSLTTLTHLCSSLMMLDILVALDADAQNVRG